MEEEINKTLNRIKNSDFYLEKKKVIMNNLKKAK